MLIESSKVSGEEIANVARNILSFILHPGEQVALSFFFLQSHPVQIAFTDLFFGRMLGDLGKFFEAVLACSPEDAFEVTYNH